MDLYEFTINPLNDRAQLVWDYGRYLATRTEKDYKIHLYFMGAFYAEVWYLRDQNQIRQVRAFKSQTCLEAYLDLVSLNLE